MATTTAAAAASPIVWQTTSSPPPGKPRRRRRRGLVSYPGPDGRIYQLYREPGEHLSYLDGDGHRRLHLQCAVPTTGGGSLRQPLDAHICLRCGYSYSNVQGNQRCPECRVEALDALHQRVWGEPLPGCVSVGDAAQRARGRVRLIGRIV